MELINRFQEAISKANTIIITTHILPDADGIGSQVALSLALKSIGKDVYCVNEEKLLPRYQYLDSNNFVLSVEEATKIFTDKDIDLLIVADTNSLDRIGSKIHQLVSKSEDLLFIDHHPCPKEISALHCVDTKMAATGELVGKLIESIGVEFDRAMALALYTAIIIDTSSFRYPTVTSNTHLLVSKLLKAGITPVESYYKIYGAQKINFLKLLGQILSRAESTPDGKVAWLVLSDDDLKQFGIENEETYGFINHLLVLDGIKVVCMFRQLEKFVKISFRSMGDVDVGVIAQALGGGGHNHSSATVIENRSIDTVIKQTISKLQIMLNDD